MVHDCLVGASERTEVSENECSHRWLREQALRSNEKLGEVSRDNPRGKFLEGKSLNTPSRMMFIKLSRICPKDLGHDTKMASVRKPRETNCRSMSGQASEGHLKAWISEVDDRFPSKCLTMNDEHMTARKIYDKEKTR